MPATEVLPWNLACCRSASLDPAPDELAAQVDQTVENRQKVGAAGGIETTGVGGQPQTARSVL